MRLGIGTGSLIGVCFPKRLVENYWNGDVRAKRQRLYRGFQTHVNSVHRALAY